MKFAWTLVILSAFSVPSFAQNAPATAQVTAAQKLQADLKKTLRAASLPDDQKAKLIADADRLVANATARAQGAIVDRKAGRAAAEEIGKMSQSGTFSTDDAALLKQDLKNLQAAAQ